MPRRFLPRLTTMHTAFALAALLLFVLELPARAQTMPLPEGFSDTFSHHTTTLSNGVKLHYVRGGQAGGSDGNAPTIFLSHGFPSTWYEWRDVMSALAERFDVVAVDLRGLGDSTAPLGADFDARSMAKDIRLLADELGVTRAYSAGHDVGAPVAFMFAADNPDIVEKLVVIELVLAGAGLEELIAADPAALWHFPFQQVPDLPERLVAGNEYVYYSSFFRPYAYDPTVFTDEVIEGYVDAYRRAGAMRAGFGIYRDLEKTAEAVKSLDGKIAQPVLAIAGAASLGNPALGDPSPAEASIDRVASNVRVEVLERVAHWVMEEAPERTAKLMVEFLAENADGTAPTSTD